MNFRQLYYIITIYEEGSISKAADKLYISQPALSHHLLKLESELGIKIFDRSRTPLTTTYAGSKFIDFVQKVLFEENQMNNELSDISHLKKGNLSIGIPSNRSLQILPLVLPNFVKEYPGIELQIKEFRSTTLENMVLNNEIDFALMVPKSSSPLITFKQLAIEDVILAVHRNNAINVILNGKTSANITLFKNFPFILMKEGHQLRFIADKVFQASHVQPNYILETSNLDLAVRLVSAGLGISFITSLAAATFLNHEKLVYYQLAPHPIQYSIGVQYHVNKHISEAMQLFINHVKMAVNKLSSDRPPFGCK